MGESEGPRFGLVLARFQLKRSSPCEQETFTPQSYESGGQTYGGQRESGTQMGIGNWVTKVLALLPLISCLIALSSKDLRVNDVSAADLTELHLLLLTGALSKLLSPTHQVIAFACWRAAGECYIKEHIWMKLSEDRQGLVKQWCAIR